MLIFRVLILFFLGWGPLASGAQTRAIYGNDNRLEYYQVANPHVQKLAQSSMALFKPWDIKNTKDGYYEVTSESLGDKENMCEDEAFIEQPAGAYCSGVLIAPDQVLTAGHCVKYGSLTCWAITFAFGYAYENPKKDISFISEDDVYHCDRVLYQEEDGEYDIAVIQLDREVPDRTPVKVRQGEANVGDEVLAIGHPLGIPQKIASGAKIRKVNSDTFVANLDTFVHNSGSPIFNSNTYELEGVLIAGEDDFIFSQKAQCNQVKHCTDGGCTGETVVDATYVQSILNEISE